MKHHRESNSSEEWKPSWRSRQSLIPCYTSRVGCILQLGCTSAASRIENSLFTDEVGTPCYFRVGGYSIATRESSFCHLRLCLLLKPHFILHDRFESVSSPRSFASTGKIRRVNRLDRYCSAMRFSFGN